MKPLTKSQQVLLCLIVVVSLLIWAQSLFPAAQSREQSDAVGGFLAALLGDGFVASFLIENIRKVAHFAEFGLLGVLWTAFAYTRKTRLGLWLLIPGAVTAVVDELLQLISEGRAAQAVDVLLDTAGYITGWLCVLMAVILWRFFRRQKRV